MGHITVEVNRLAAAARSGELAELCRTHGLDLLVLFGSAVPVFDAAELGPRAPSKSGEPRDIDLAIAIERGAAPPDVLAILQDLYLLTGSERIDLMVLDHAGPVARQRALTRGRMLFEGSPGRFAEAQILAAMEYLDTAPFRELALGMLANR